jgi:hypothetical protein
MIPLGMISPFFVLALVVITLIAMLYALIDILKSEFKGNDKLIWVLVVLFTGLIGALLYLAIGKKQKVVGGR